MEIYPSLNFGEYKGTAIDRVPMKYLVWLFPVLKHKRNNHEIYKAILHYFLQRDVRIEETKTGLCKFYFNDYTILSIIGSERPFLTTFQKLSNSKGEDVYEVGNQEYPLFIENIDGLKLSFNYNAIRYRFGGVRMVYERNPNYYFKDGDGKIMRGAYLMRLPWVPHNERQARQFSENLPIKELTNNKK
jgi:hypothetical protein